MEVVSRKSSGGGGGRFILDSSSSRRANRPLSLTLYNDPPDEAISLEEFENLAVDRLRVLSVAENALSRGDKPNEVMKKLQDALRNTHLEVRDPEEKRLDNISHWVMRLAFAASDELRRRFLVFETLLFEYRFTKRLDMTEIERFMRENELGYSPISKSERDEHYEQLRDVYAASVKYRNAQKNAPISSIKSFESTQHYKVRFTEVTDLVSKRLVYLHKGNAYVPETELISILSSRFRTSLSKKLAIAYRSLPYVKRDDRVRPLLKMLENAYLGPEYGDNSGGATCLQDVTPDNIKHLAGQSFPMCMREIHAIMTKEHHIKYHARLQFQLFLKGIGLSMKDCVYYFQREFVKKPMSPDEFNKKYSYNIRHAYGKEGKRKDYLPMNCTMIIQNAHQPGAGEAHGCPFKTYGPTTMKKILTKQMGTTQKDKIDEICDKIANKEFQVACRYHFAATHPGSDGGNVGAHPNTWYEESIKHFQKLNGAQSAGTSTTSTSSSAESTKQAKENTTMET